MSSSAHVEPDEHAPLVLLISGQPGSSPLWSRLRPILRSYGLRVLSVQPRSHRAGAGARQLQQAAALQRLLQHQRSAAIVVGHGVGAGTALALAAIAPHHVGSLVLVAPDAGVSVVSRIASRLAGVAWQVRRRLRRSAIRGRGVIVPSRRLVMDARQLEPHLPPVQCPILVVAGARDRKAPAGAVRRKLPDFDLITTDAQHPIPVDDPGVVATAVLRALRAQFRNSVRTVRRPLAS
jgi:pimeloyl-ACP methyl ester carboxylesterase